MFTRFEACCAHLRMADEIGEKIRQLEKTYHTLEKKQEEAYDKVPDKSGPYMTDYKSH